jgi:voltage-gated potassium channel
MTTQTRLRVAIALLVAIVFIGATGFHYIEGWPWFDGLYMTVITLTTIGYGETHPLSTGGKWFNIFLILAAVIAGAFLISAATQVMLQFELHNFLGRRRMQRELARLHNHYIICGAGRVGRSVARELRARRAHFAFIEKSTPRAQWALDRGFPVVIGNAHSEEDLTKAHIDTAKGLVAAVTSDAENLYIVLTARGMNPDLKIIARASEEEATSKLITAGVMVQPHVIDFLEAAFGSQRLDVQLEEVAVPESSTLAGQILGATEIRELTGALILALKRVDGSVSFNPRSEDVIHPGDHLIAVGSVQHLQALASLAQR